MYNMDRIDRIFIYFFIYFYLVGQIEPHVDNFLISNLFNTNWWQTYQHYQQGVIFDLGYGFKLDGVQIEPGVDKSFAPPLTVVPHSIIVLF